MVNIEIPLIYNKQCVGAITAVQVICTEPNDSPKEAATAAFSAITNYITQSVAYTNVKEKLAKQTEELLKAENKRIQLEKQLHMAQLDAKSSVSLVQELNYIRNYLAIQSIRFGDRIHYEIACDRTLHSEYIPFFSLQPLVENSIEHGLLNKASGGNLLLSCKDYSTHFTIVIQDDGIGIDTESLDALTNQFHLKEKQRNEHVGLYNCYKRLQIMFGDKLTFHIESKEQSGTTITINLLK